MNEAITITDVQDRYPEKCRDCPMLVAYALRYLSSEKSGLDDRVLIRSTVPKMGNMCPDGISVEENKVICGSKLVS